MSSGKTEYYQLHLWEPEDNFVRVEFNENHQKVDAALAAKCDTAAFQAHKQSIEAAVASKADNAAFQAHKQSIESAVASKADNTAFQAHKQSIEAAVASKADNAAFQAHKQSIEAAVASKADNAAFQTLKQSVESTLPGKCEIQTGTYTGNWSQASAAQHITLGRQPKAVLIWDNHSQKSNNQFEPCFGMGITGCSGAGVEITADGFTVRTASDFNGPLYPSLNKTGWHYMYLAFF